VVLVEQTQVVEVELVLQVLKEIKQVAQVDLESLL
jgi:hypothetical protein